MARLLFFGKLGDLAQARMREFPLGGADTLSALKAAITEADTMLGEALADPSVRCAINEELSHGDAPIADDDEIAFMPPVSGG